MQLAKKPLKTITRNQYKSNPITKIQAHISRKMELQVKELLTWTVHTCMLFTLGRCWSSGLNLKSAVSHY